MRKTILLLILIFIFSVYFVNPVAIFIYNETDLVSLEPKAHDPDNQELQYFYTEPLNSQGQWQTTYGDAGIYNITITVSDGDLSDSADVLLMIQKKEEQPQIKKYKPKVDEIEIYEGQTVNFLIKATDLNKDELKYYWYLGDMLIGEGDKYSYSPNYGDAGVYNIKAVISDGVLEAVKEWRLTVREVDIDGMLDDIPDINATETDIVRIALPDLNKLGLRYNITEPVGNDNYWLTDYEDEGEYEVEIHVEGKGYFGEEEVKIKVNNKDRPPIFHIKDTYYVKEDNELEINLSATDPDGEEVFFSAEDLPEDAELSENKFRWKPSFDYVRKENILDRARDKLRILSRTRVIRFAAETKEGMTQKDVKIVVLDNNRPFILYDFEAIEVHEGEIVKIKPKYEDPDDDWLTFTYSGWMTSDTYQTNYEDSGEYYVKVTASDGYNSDYRFVKITVIDTNRKPVLYPLNDYEVSENESLRFELRAEDYDLDKIIFSADNMPPGATLKGNVFEWTPDFDFVSSEEQEKSINITFTASDGKEKSYQNTTITVYHTNRGPKLINFSEEADFKVNEPALFWVNAEDKDNDELTYRWTFSWLEKYEATAIMERIFSYPGEKKVKVIVSDGKEEIEHEWDVNVKPLEAISQEQETAVEKEKEEAAKNNPPQIISVSSKTSIYVNEPITLLANAIDKDKDNLRYIWVFDNGQTYEGKDSVTTVFRSTGKRKVKVLVTDNKDTVQYVWDIIVNPKPAIQEPIEQEPTPNIYDRYIVVQTNGEITSSTREQFVVY